jgi:hypothetical protein
MITNADHKSRAQNHLPASGRIRAEVPVILQDRGDVRGRSLLDLGPAGSSGLPGRILRLSRGGLSGPRTSSDSSRPTTAASITTTPTTCTFRPWEEPRRGRAGGACRPGPCRPVHGREGRRRRAGRCRAQRRVAAAAPDRSGDLGDLTVDTAGDTRAEPPTVAHPYLRRVLPVHRLDVLPGRQRLRLDVTRRSQLEPGGGEQARPVGQQLRAEWYSRARSARSSAAVGGRSNTRSLKPTCPPGRSTRRSSASSRGLSAARTQISPAASRQIASKAPSGKGMCSALPCRMSTRAASRPGRSAHDPAGPAHS